MLETKEDQVEALEVEVLELTASLEAYKKQARDSEGFAQRPQEVGLGRVRGNFRASQDSGQRDRHCFVPRVYRKVSRQSYCRKGPVSVAPTHDRKKNT